MAPKTGTIELHLREVVQIYDPLDPSPLEERDLSRNADEYIFDSAVEVPSKAPLALVIYIDQDGGPGQTEGIVKAVRAHFARRSLELTRDLTRLLRRGAASLGIGLGVLAFFFLAGQAAGGLMREGAFRTLVQESMLIGGWVAMWRPLEIFLYDWWPIMLSRRTCDRLKESDVRVVHAHKHP